MEEKLITSSEILLNLDLVSLIQKRFNYLGIQYNVVKGKVLKDIFLYKHDEQDVKKFNANYSFQFGFVDQDIVIYNEKLDVSDLLSKDIKSIFFHNIKEKEREAIIIPRIIIELKYGGVTSHGLITYSQYASDIKSIFPDCKYYLLVMYRKGASINKLQRHATSIDKIAILDDSSSVQKYEKGDFENRIISQANLANRFDNFINELSFQLNPVDIPFIK